MKKYVIYIAILVVGLILGWFLFGESTAVKEPHDHDKEVVSTQQWTCSMHPQIMQHEAGDCPICGMDLIPAATTLEGLAADHFNLTKNAMALANIQTIVVGIGNVEEHAVKLSGKITENEDETATQPSHFDGRIEKLFITSLGQKIKKGQIIGTVYSPELVTAQQELITAYSTREVQPKLYEAVKKKFKNWKIRDNQLEEIISTKQIKSQFTIYSHVTGVVSEINVNEGAHILNGHSIFKVANLNTVWAIFDVYENQVNLFKKGQEVVVSTNAYPTKEFKAKVSFIDPVLDTKTRTVKLRVVLNNAANLFKPGMFVEGKIKEIKTSSTQAIIIPSSAILWTGERSVIYLKTNSNEPVFEMREITVGNKIGENYEVLSGLYSGNEIVTNGAFTVDAAAQLQGKKSMMNKEGGKTSTGHEGHMGMEISKTASDSKTASLSDRIEVSTTFQTQLKSVFDTYINIKNALVDDDAIVAKVAAKGLISKLSNVDMNLLTTGEAHKQWMPIAKEIKELTNLINSTSELDEQRNYFIKLSSKLISAVQIFGINQKVFVQFCSMADDNNGAYWLSMEQEIRNPYFGAAMLDCGEVTETIEN